MTMYVFRLIRTPDKEYKSPRSLGVRVNESRLYIYIYIYIYIYTVPGQKYSTTTETAIQIVLKWVYS